MNWRAGPHREGWLSNFILVVRGTDTLRHRFEPIANITTKLPRAWEKRKEMMTMKNRLEDALLTGVEA